MNSPKLELRYDLMMAVMDEARVTSRSYSETIFENSILYEHEKEFIMSSLFPSNKNDDEKYVVTVGSWYQPSSVTNPSNNNWKANNAQGYTVISSSSKLYNFL